MRREGRRTGTRWRRGGDCLVPSHRSPSFPAPLIAVLPRLRAPPISPWVLPGVAAALPPVEPSRRMSGQACGLRRQRGTNQWRCDRASSAVSQEKQGRSTRVDDGSGAIPELTTSNGGSQKAGVVPEAESPAGSIDKHRPTTLQVQLDDNSRRLTADARTVDHAVAMRSAKTRCECLAVSITKYVLCLMVEGMMEGKQEDVPRTVLGDHKVWLFKWLKHEKQDRPSHGRKGIEIDKFVKIIECLFSYYTNLVLANAGHEMKSEDEATPLHYAVQVGALQTVKLLIKNMVDVNVADNDGWTPLHLAIQSRNRDIAMILLVNVADKTRRIKLLSTNTMYTLTGAA
uniref:Uncharacterized protein n=1 Tax=Oryza punctata TaxID=4537 RepID=A0A0E0JGK4_ORYPU